MVSLRLPVLYILMRTDLESMNPGKAVAQGSHATSVFHQRMEMIERLRVVTAPISPVEDTAKSYVKQSQLYAEWSNETSQGFGTVLTLDVDESLMRKAVIAAGNSGFVNAIVRDPTYPVRDGKIMHKISLDTCAFVFGYKDELELLLDNLGLMR